MLNRIARAFTALTLFASAARAEDVTYCKQVAPILWHNCASCHRPGEIGPFPLLTYKDAEKRAGFIKEITQDRRMPPWKPEPGYGDFRDVRRLSDDDLRTLARWADAGAPEGDTKDLPAMPHFPDGWQLGKPDLVLTMPKTFKIYASGRDIYRNFVLKIPIDKDRTVAATEFRPGNRRVVHHALFFLDAFGQARRRDGEDGQPGYSTFGGIGVLPSGGLGGWAPGATPRRLPEGTGMFLAKGSELVMQIHYHPDGKEETDLSSVGIYFTSKPATTIVGGIAVRTRKLDIPPGEKHCTVHAESQPLPVDVKALAIFPHMHNLGREMKVTAYPPSGGELPLIWIRDWDFNWQGAYGYKQPMHLPKGTVIKVDAVYDNSSDNPKNPSDPPQRVHWGEQDDRRNVPLRHDGRHRLARRFEESPRNELCPARGDHGRRFPAGRARIAGCPDAAENRRRDPQEDPRPSPCQGLCHPRSRKRIAGPVRSGPRRPPHGGGGRGHARTAS